MVAPSPVGQNMTINQFVGLTFDRVGQYLVEVVGRRRDGTILPMATFGPCCCGAPLT